MTANPDLASTAALIADPSRAAMLSALLGGHSLPAGELAHHARISPQTASTHLHKLVEGGLLSVTKSGRHRYYALRSKEVGQALEALTLIAPRQRIRSLNQSLEAEAICRARTCYDHLAGSLGVAITDALTNCQIIQRYDEVFEVTAAGQAWFAEFGIDCAHIQEKRRTFASTCVDWSERKPHIAGALGAAIADRMFATQWIIRTGESRAVKVTDLGRKMLKQSLNISA